MIQSNDISSFQSGGFHGFQSLLIPKEYKRPRQLPNV